MNFENKIKRAEHNFADIPSGIQRKQSKNYIFQKLIYFFFISNKIYITLLLSSNIFAIICQDISFFPNCCIEGHCQLITQRRLRENWWIWSSGGGDTDIEDRRNSRENFSRFSQRWFGKIIICVSVERIFKSSTLSNSLTCKIYLLH